MLNIAHACITHDVNGPGRRFTVWVQGCPRECPGCFNADLQPTTQRLQVAPAELARQALASVCDGSVSLSGGEPFQQAEELAAFLDLLVELRGGRKRVSAVVFSGYTLEELQDGPAAWRALLARVDLLVDGPYQESFRSPGLPLRGSSNQRLIALTPCGEDLQAKVSTARNAEVQVHISSTGEILISGFPPPELVRSLGGDGTG